jgi:glycosyltransferase involved in cell wall biosynthesis
MRRQQNSRGRILVTYLGDPTRRTAGNLVRIRQVLHFLCDSGFDVTFYSFENITDCAWTREGESAFISEFPSIRRVCDRWTMPLSIATRIKNNTLAILPRATRFILSLGVPHTAPNWRNLIREERFEKILVNYALHTTLLNGVPIENCVIETHDLEFRELSMARRRPVWHWDTLRRMRRELAILEAAAGVIAIAATERTILEAMLTHRNVLYVPPHFAVQPIALNPKAQFDLVFVGGLNHKNETGINEFLKSAADWHHPPVIAIAGHICVALKVPPALEGRVSALGYVADMSALYRNSKIAIAPVDGTGVNMKVLEALSVGRPVLAYPSAIAALPPGSEHCVFELDEMAATALLSDSEGLAAAGRAALRYALIVEKHAGWEKLARTLAGADPAGVEH